MQARMRQACLAVVVATILVALGGGAFAQSNSDVGTWTLNVAKSKYSPGPPPKSATTKIEAAGAGVKTTVDQGFPDGTRHWRTPPTTTEDIRVTGNNPDAGTIARTRVNATTVQTVNKKGGKVTTTNTSIISSDGKTRTVTTKGTNAQGQMVNNVAVNQKQ